MHSNSRWPQFPRRDSVFTWVINVGRRSRLSLPRATVGLGVVTTNHSSLGRPNNRGGWSDAAPPGDLARRLPLERRDGVSRMTLEPTRVALGER
jgi:hypothetical protein